VARPRISLIAPQRSGDGRPRTDAPEINAAILVAFRGFSNECSGKGCVGASGVVLTGNPCEQQIIAQPANSGEVAAEPYYWQVCITGQVAILTEGAGEN